jgi:hypothetical protein
MTAPAIAFAATDVEGARKRLRSRNVKFRESIVPRTGDTQIFLYDLDGVGLELNFPGIGSAVRRFRTTYAGWRFPIRSRHSHLCGVKRSAFPQFCMTS